MSTGTVEALSTYLDICISHGVKSTAAGEALVNAMLVNQGVACCLSCVEELSADHRRGEHKAQPSNDCPLCPR